MKRMEDVPDGRSGFPRCRRAIEPRPAANPNPISVAFVDAAREQGYPVTDDFNGERFEGAGFHDLLIKDGRRTSAAATYLHPASGRPNLDVVTGAHVARVLTAGDRCTGVEYVRNGATPPAPRRARGHHFRRRRRLAGDPPALGHRPCRRARGARRRVGRRRARRRPKPARPPADGRAVGGQAASAGARVQPRRVFDVPPQPSGQGGAGSALHVHPCPVPPADLPGAGGLVDDRGRPRAAREPRQRAAAIGVARRQAADRPRLPHAGGGRRGDGSRHEAGPQARRRRRVRSVAWAGGAPG